MTNTEKQILPDPQFTELVDSEDCTRDNGGNPNLVPTSTISGDRDRDLALIAGCLAGFHFHTI